LSFVFEVALVSDEDFAHVFLSVAGEENLLVYLDEPALDGLEGLAVGNVEHDHDAVCAAVVVAGDRFELFLARRVPLMRRTYDLQAHFLVIDR
jgi:hypothetical protein